MHKELAKLIIYRDMSRENILSKLGDIFEDFENVADTPEHLKTRIFIEVRRLLELATQYGFDKNLWHNYLTYLLITDENPFSFTAEKAERRNGTVNRFALNDFEVFKNLFDFDFSKIENALDINCFSVLSDYNAIPKREQMYNKNVSEKVQALSEKIEAAGTPEEIFDAVVGFYHDYGVGMFGLNKAFRLAYKNEAMYLAPINNMNKVSLDDLIGYERQKDALVANTEAFVEGRAANNVLLYGDSGTGKSISFKPINNMDSVMLDDLIGYEIQKKKLVDNTQAFVDGKKANNVLLFGDSGTGKSTSIKAIVNRFYDRGLRMIEIYKHQFKDLSAIISQIKNRNYRFIIYMDDLSFEDYEIEYKYLKAIIEGGVETKPDNVLIYATSNRRHLIKETFNDKNDIQTQQDVHRSETVEEKLSLVHRFGLTIGYFKPSKLEFEAIVLELARRHPEITLSDDEIISSAQAWQMRNGGISCRTAQQFVDHLIGISKI